MHKSTTTFIKTKTIVFIISCQQIYPDHPSNEANLILDNCVQKLLRMKDNECIDMIGIQTVVLGMMNELEENRLKNIDPSMNLVDSDEETYAERLKDHTSSENSSNLE